MYKLYLAYIIVLCIMYWDRFPFDQLILQAHDSIAVFSGVSEVIAIVCCKISDFFLVWSLGVSKYICKYVKTCHCVGVS